MEQVKAAITNLNCIVLSKKVVQYICLAFMILTFCYLFPRGLASTTDKETSSITNAISLYQAIPLILISMLAEYNRRTKALINKLANEKVIFVTGIAILIAASVLTISGSPIFYWWTWFSFGLMIAITLVTMTLVKIPTIDAFLLGAGIATLWRGLWELPYQIGLKLIYDAPQITTPHLWQLLRYEITVEIPLIVGGGLLIWFYVSKHHLFNFNRRTVIFLSLYLVAMIVWFAGGMWVEINYDWYFHTWRQAQIIDFDAMATYKFSKVALALGLVFLVYKESK